MAAHKQLSLLATGARAPDFRLPLLGGAETTLAEIVAHPPAVLAFFKVTCPVCQLTFPFLERLHAGGTLAIYGISQNDAGDTREFNRRFGVTFPTLLDNEENGFRASNAFGISSVPTLFLVERAGSVARVVEGWSKRDIEWLAGKAGVAAFRPDDNVPEWKAG
ncbi:MAG: TlpA family protein disulfide reductase [Acidobacteriia bacterium]|nr:TlpA family protein disulfide reductase [Terriglobia bacterium]